MNKLIFSIPIPPGVNEYKKYRVLFQGGRNIPVPYLTKETQDFKQYMHYLMTREANKNNWITPEDNKYIKLSLIFYMNKLGKDADNHIKLIQDSLQETGLVKNDSKIIPSVKRLFVDKENPRVIIKLEELPWIGVFSDETHRKYFIDENCNNCKRFKRNCSILKSLDENKISKDVNNNITICHKKTEQKQK